MTKDLWRVPVGRAESRRPCLPWGNFDSYHLGVENWTKESICVTHTSVTIVVVLHSFTSFHRQYSRIPCVSWFSTFCRSSRPPPQGTFLTNGCWEGWQCSLLISSEPLQDYKLTSTMRAFYPRRTSCHGTDQFIPPGRPTMVRTSSRNLISKLRNSFLSADRTTPPLARTVLSKIPTVITPWNASLARHWRCVTTIYCFQTRRPRSTCPRASTNVSNAWPISSYDFARIQFSSTNHKSKSRQNKSISMDSIQPACPWAAHLGAGDR